MSTLGWVKKTALFVLKWYPVVFGIGFFGIIGFVFFHVFIRGHVEGKFGSQWGNMFAGVLFLGGLFTYLFAPIVLLDLVVRGVRWWLHRRQAQTGSSNLIK